MSYQHVLPRRVRVLILGGGIHGVGVLHDMASRGWRDIHLIDKGRLGFGTSSRSTKLIHGGLRYLKQVRNFSMVMESLRERSLLLKVAPDIVHPIEMIFPILKKGGMASTTVKAGLWLYDYLAGKDMLSPHRKISLKEAIERVPILNPELFSGCFRFADAQTDDLALVHRVAASAVKLGGGISEGSIAQSISPSDDGWQVEVTAPDGSQHTISALYVVNTLGPWSNSFLEKSHILPTHKGFNDKGAHLIIRDLGLKSALFLQSPDDGRIFFILPWQGKTLIGTTEDIYSGNPDDLQTTKADVHYLLERCNRYLSRPLMEHDVEQTFSGLRWLPIERGKDISATSRASIVGSRQGKRGLLLTLYGGKLTSYRKFAEEVGDRVTQHFGEFVPSKTDDPKLWATREEVGDRVMDIQLRFVEPQVGEFNKKEVLALNGR